MIAIFHIVRIITHQITSQWGLHAQWSMKVARQKRSEICAVRVAKSKKNDLFWEHFFPDQKATKHWKGCHFFQHVDAPTRAIPHPAGCFWSPNSGVSCECSHQRIPGTSSKQAEWLMGIFIWWTTKLLCWRGQTTEFQKIKVLSAWPKTWRSQVTKLLQIKPWPGLEKLEPKSTVAYHKFP